MGRFLDPANPLSVYTHLASVGSLPCPIHEMPLGLFDALRWLLLNKRIGWTQNELLMYHVQLAPKEFEKGKKAPILARLYPEFASVLKQAIKKGTEIDWANPFPGLKLGKRSGKRRQRSS